MVADSRGSIIYVKGVKHQTISLLFIRFTDSRNNTRETRTIHAKLTSRNPLKFASVNARTILTMCVNGSTVRAKYCIGSGRSDSGKKVPLKGNIGVQKKLNS